VSDDVAAISTSDMHSHIAVRTAEKAKIEVATSTSEVRGETSSEGLAGPAYGECI